jgi:hypothetical protein
LKAITSSVCFPKVAVPKHSRDTVKPVLPKLVICKAITPLLNPPSHLGEQGVVLQADFIIERVPRQFARRGYNLISHRYAHPRWAFR